MSREPNALRAGPRTPWAGLAGATCLVALVGCASVPIPTEQVARATTLVQRAEETRDIESAALSLRKAQDELAEAKNAMRKEAYVEARRKAERAEVDAEVALSEAERARAHRAAEERAQTINAMEQEMYRNPGMVPAGGLQ